MDSRKTYGAVYYHDGHTIDFGEIAVTVHKDENGETMSLSDGNISLHVDLAVVEEMIRGERETFGRKGA